MQFKLNSEKVDISLTHEKHAWDILQAFCDQLSAPLILTGFFVNGNPMAHAGKARLSAYALEDIHEIEFFVMDRELARQEIQAETRDLLERMQQHVADSASWTDIDKEAISDSLSIVHDACIHLSPRGIQHLGAILQELQKEETGSKDLVLSELSALSQQLPHAMRTQIALTMSHLKQCATLLHQGETKKAAQLLTDSVDSIESLMGLAKTKKIRHPYIHQLELALIDINQALEKADYVELADLVEYELTESLNQVLSLI